MGYTFKTLDERSIHCTDPCVNQLQASAADALAAAAKSKNDFITLQSATRSSAQQYLLWMWYQGRKCGIPLAAQPGTSNHEGGRAVDVTYYNDWISTLSKFGWVHSYPTSDPVHFDYNDAKDLAKQNLIAFQKLYNKHTNSHIAEDGVYGPDTQRALANSPCDGW